MEIFFVKNYILIEHMDNKHMINFKKTLKTTLAGFHKAIFHILAMAALRLNRRPELGILWPVIGLLQRVIK